MAKKKKIKGLTIHFIPYAEISGLGSTDRIKKLLQIVLKNKVIILQGRLKPEEEVRLIEDTMVLVGSLKNFTGIELAVINPKTEINVLGRFKRGIANALVGDTSALTVIGPANIIKEMRKDPRNLEIFMSGK